MKIFRIFIAGFLLFICVSSGAFGFQEPDRNIVIYSNMAYIVETRNLNVESGLHEYSFSDLPARIIHESIFIEKLGGDFDIIRQEYDENVFDFNILLEKHIGKSVSINLEDNEVVRGILVNVSSTYILIRERDVITAVSKSKIKSFSIEGIEETPGHKSVLRLFVSSRQSKHIQVNLHYLASGISWSGEYVGTYNPGNKTLQLKSWARIRNNSGKDLHAGKLVLVAGDLSRRPAGREMLQSRAYVEKLDMEIAAAPEFKAGEAFIYHKYTLNQPVDIGNKKEQQIQLFSEKKINISEKYVYDRSQYGDKVFTILNFKNDQNSGMGAPIPSGLVKIYRIDKDGSLYLGEDPIKDTPVSEDVKIHIGAAFDITAKRILKNYQRYDNRRRDETYELTFRNATGESKAIEINEHYTGQWRIINNSHDYNIEDANTVQFNVTIPSKDSLVLTYTVRYNW